MNKHQQRCLLFLVPGPVMLVPVDMNDTVETLKKNGLTNHDNAKWQLTAKGRQLAATLTQELTNGTHTATGV